MLFGRNNFINGNKDGEEKKFDLTSFKGTMCKKTQKNIWYRALLGGNFYTLEGLIALFVAQKKGIFCRNFQPNFCDLS